MNIQDLPPAVLVKIFHYLPFKTRVRSARVSKLFRSVSKSAIDEMKELFVSRELAAYALSGGLKSLIANCSPRLVRIIVERRQSNYYNNNEAYACMNWAKIIICTLLDYTFPRVIDIKFELDMFKIHGFDLIKQCPNLKSFAYASSSPMNRVNWEEIKEIRNMKNWEKLKSEGVNRHNPAIFDFKSEKIDLCECDENMLPSVVDLFPILKHIRFGNFDGRVETLDDFFHGYPQLESIDVTFNSYKPEKNDLEKLSHFWRLSNLKTLSLKYVVATDAVFYNIAYHFPELETLRISAANVITEKAMCALAVLSNLRSLKLNHTDYYSNHKFFDFSSATVERLSDFDNLTDLEIDQLFLSAGSFAKIVRSCEKLVNLKIHSVTDVHSPEKVVELLESLSGLTRGKELSITFRDQTELFMGLSGRVGVWDTNEVKEILKKLKIKVTFDKRR